MPYKKKIFPIIKDEYKRDMTILKVGYGLTAAAVVAVIYTILLKNKK